MAVIPRLVAARADVLHLHSPYHFVRHLSPDAVAWQERHFGIGRATSFGAGPEEKVYTTSQSSVQFLCEHLPWDTAFFGASTLRLFTALFDARTTSLLELTRAVQEFQQNALLAPAYCFAEVPAEDIRLLQALTQAGWRWVETRLQYHLADVVNFAQPQYSVRLTQPDEAEHVGRIAAAARNEYDRFHADPWFGPERADAFLARYATAATEGYCDAVLVPDEAGVPVDSFLAISDLTSHAMALGIGLSRVVLTAVGPANRGWHLRLLSETVQRARQRGAAAVLMTTQATNRAVIRNAEKLNFALGATTHVLSCPVPA